MSKFRNLLVMILVLAVFIVTGCDKIPFLKPKPAPPKPTAIQPPLGVTVVARVGNLFITADDFNLWVDNYNLQAPYLNLPKLDTRENKIDYLRQIVDNYLLYQEALDRGLHKKDDITRKLEFSRINILKDELIKEEIGKIEVASKEIEDYYNQNKDKYPITAPEQRKILEIMTPTEEEAKQAYIELLKGTDFATLAKQYSKAPSAAKGGEVGLISLIDILDPNKRTKFDKFYEVAFSTSLEVGNISSIFKGPDGYYIIKLESLKKPEAKSLSDVWDLIKKGLLNEKQVKAITDLASKLTGETKIEVYEGKID